MLLVSAAVFMVLVAVGVFYQEKQSFAEALSGVTEIYYNDEFLNGNREKQKELTRKAEKKLPCSFEGISGKRRAEKTSFTACA